jgi:hypothetical protein
MLGIAAIKKNELQWSETDAFDLDQNIVTEARQAVGISDLLPVGL